MKNLVDHLKTNVLENCCVGGHVGLRLSQCFEHSVKANDSAALADVFTRHEGTCDWKGEFWGKWMLGAVPAYRYTKDPSLLVKIQASVKNVLECQGEDGYIGNYRDDHHLSSWDIWGRKYTLSGLLQYYDLFGDSYILEASCRLVDHLILEVSPNTTGKLQAVGMHHGMASLSILEPIVLLFKRTASEKYLQFAEYIVQCMDVFTDSPKLISKAVQGVPVAERFPRPENWWSWDNGIKAYEMMSCYQGMLELYLVNGNELLLQASENSALDIMEREINAAGSGSAFECWFHGKHHETVPVYHNMETCVTTTWLKFCQTLLSITKKPQYGDYFEKAFYNAYLGAMASDGSTFSKYTPLTGSRGKGEDQCGMPINCCIANGPRGFVALLEGMVMYDKDNLYIQHYLDSKSTVLLSEDGDKISIIQETDYPVGDRVFLEISLETPIEFYLHLRNPKCNPLISISVNGTLCEVLDGEIGYMKILRTWESGDRIELQFDMRGRVEVKQGHFAIFRGPILLARDRRLCSDSTEEILSFPQDEKIELQVQKTSDGKIWQEYSLRLHTGLNCETEEWKEKNVHFCDFSSAGNTWDHDSFYRSWNQIPINVRESQFDGYNTH